MNEFLWFVQDISFVTRYFCKINVRKPYQYYLILYMLNVTTASRHNYLFIRKPLIFLLKFSLCAIDKRMCWLSTFAEQIVVHIWFPTIGFNRRKILSYRNLWQFSRRKKNIRNPQNHMHISKYVVFYMLL